MGVTLELLYLEYLQAHPTGLRYTAFCDVYRAWLAKAGVVMRQTHKAGEKCFVDYSGKKPSYVGASTGEIVGAELFFAVLGASNYRVRGGDGDATSAGLHRGARARIPLLWRRCQTS